MIVDSVRVHMRTGRHVLVLRESGSRPPADDLGGRQRGERDRDEAPGRDARAAAHPRPHGRDARRGRRPRGPDRHQRPRGRDVPRPAAARRHDSRHEIDARPSDAIALAVRIGAPIYATTDVLDRAATSPDDDDDDEEGGEGSTCRRPRSRRRASRSTIRGSTSSASSSTRSTSTRRVAAGARRARPPPGRIGRPRRRARSRFAHSRSRSAQKSFTARMMTSGWRRRRARGPRIVGTPTSTIERPRFRILISSSAEKNAPPDSTRTPSSEARVNSLHAQSTSRTRRPKKTGWRACTSARRRSGRTDRRA